MIERVEAPTFRREDFGPGKRAGLAAIVRLRNEEDYAEAALKSILPYFDEIVIVFNDCTDRTPEIVAEFARDNPERVRAFHYVPRVFRPGSDAHRRLPANSVHSMVHYSNFALSKVSYQVCCKWDGDQIAEPAAFGAVVRRLRRLEGGARDKWLSPWRWGYWWYTGVNLWDHQGQVAVPQVRPLIGLVRDHGFWPANRWTIFKHERQFEYLFTRLLAHAYVGCLFFHLKGMKKDRGLGNYQIDENQQSSLLNRMTERWMNSPLISLASFQAAEQKAKDMPAPAELGIHPVVER